MIAIILAAGRGSRLKKYTINLPKSLLELNSDGLTLLDYNIQTLKSIGVTKIYLITGYNSEMMEEKVSSLPYVEVVYNPFWNFCNVLGSMYMVLHKLESDFLFLHADTLVEENAWQLLVSHKDDGDMILPFVSKVCGEEEMKIIVENNQIVRISKLLDPKNATGEFVGIGHFKTSTISYFKSEAEKMFKMGKLNQYMEAVIQSSIENSKFIIRPLDLSEYKFVEVDFEEDYIEAKNSFGSN